MKPEQSSAARLGQYIRSARENRGLSRPDLAERTTKTVSALEKVENGTRAPGLDYLTELLDSLGVAHSYRELLINGLYPGLLGRLYGPSKRPLTGLDREYLRAINAPAAYMYFPSGDVVGTTEQWARILPGAGPGTNLIEWLFINPISQRALVDWEDIAHAFAFALRWLAPSAISASRIEELRAKCSAANPYFDKMWSTNVSKPGKPISQLRVRPLIGGGILAYSIQVGQHSYPGRRDWMIYTLVPDVDQGSAAA
ncbi:MAG: family transcriptional regulator [Nocardia sp.]|uniref:helix-turn-helix domain-containing protein n=1 Tax=Nocardia sp. TaxID=1821 RepID=UPI002614EC01|nr:helix-turn-helix domain-containing protein [Nocardia sp.]MCU1647112.1 family transcriptional regulator [Nocardia sp.]